MDTNKPARSGMPWENRERVKLYNGKRDGLSWDEITDSLPGRKKSAVQSQFFGPSYKDWVQVYESGQQQPAQDINRSSADNHFDLPQHQRLAASTGSSNADIRRGHNNTNHALPPPAPEFNDASTGLLMLGGHGSFNNHIAITSASAAEASAFETHRLGANSHFGVPQAPFPAADTMNSYEINSHSHNHRGLTLAPTSTSTSHRPISSVSSSVNPVHVSGGMPSMISCDINSKHTMSSSSAGGGTTTSQSERGCPDSMKALAHDSSGYHPHGWYTATYWYGRC